MKVAKVVVAIILTIIAVSMAWWLLTSVFGLLFGLIKSIIGLAFGVAVIGGLGWVILRLIGRKSLSGDKYESLP